MSDNSSMNDVNMDERIDTNTGSIVRSAAAENYYRLEFFESPRPRPTSVNVFFLELENAYRSDCHEYLDAIGFGPHNVKLVDKSGARSFVVDLIDKNWKKELITRTMKTLRSKYRVYPCVQDVVAVTVGSLSWEISDQEVLNYLCKFGEFSRDPKDIIHSVDARGYHSAERVYHADSIATEIPSYTTIFGKRLSIKYKDQPPTCRICDSKDHKAYECPNNPNYKGKRKILLHLTSLGLVVILLILLKIMLHLGKRFHSLLHLVCLKLLTLLMLKVNMQDLRFLISWHPLQSKLHQSHQASYNLRLFLR